jgi:diketogulonate reductase-like aldo/keto reductase
MQRNGLTSDDWAAWQAIEGLQADGKVRDIGISNVSREQLMLLCDRARVAPRFVQNRCYAVHGWDREVRQFCSAHGIIYQGFSLLTANAHWLAQPVVVAIANRYGKTVPQIVFRFAMEIGILPLTGTSSREHMAADLEALNLRLDAPDVHRLAGD